MARAPGRPKGANRYGEQVNEVRECRVVMMMRTDERDAVDAYQFANRIPARAKAIRELLAFAIEQKAVSS